MLKWLSPLYFTFIQVLKVKLVFYELLHFGVNAQIREQMCLETHFQSENSVLGRFGQSGVQRKKIQTAITVMPQGAHPEFGVFS